MLLDIFFRLNSALEVASAVQDLTGFAHLLFWHFRIFWTWAVPVCGRCAVSQPVSPSSGSVQPLQGHILKGFFAVNVVPALHMLWKYRREERRVRERGDILILKKKVNGMKLYVILHLKKRETLSIRTEQSISDDCKWGNGAKAVPWSVEWSTALCIGRVSWGRSHFRSTALKLVARVLFWRPLK